MNASVTVCMRASEPARAYVLVRAICGCANMYT